MGEDFLEKRNRQIRRCIDKNFEKFKGPDLFSGVAPELSSEVIGIRLPGMELSPGQTLVHLPQSSASDIFVLCRGGTQAVELSGEAAVHAAQSGAISAEITSIEGSFVALKFHARFSKN